MTDQCRWWGCEMPAAVTFGSGARRVLCAEHAKAHLEELRKEMVGLYAVASYYQSRGEEASRALDISQSEFDKQSQCPTCGQAKP